MPNALKSSVCWLLLLPATALAKDCVPLFYTSLPRERDWYYGAAKDKDSGKARDLAIRVLGKQATGEIDGWDAGAVEGLAGPGHDRRDVARNIGKLLPESTLLAGWEQDDHEVCKGVHYVMVRIEKERVLKFIKANEKFRHDLLDSLGERVAKLEAWQAKATSGEGALQFIVSSLPPMPKVNQPSMAAVGSLSRAELPGPMGQVEGVSFGSIDVDALGRYDEAVTFEKGPASPEAKADKWRSLGGEVRGYADLAAKRAAQWDVYAENAAFTAAVENDKGKAAPESKIARWESLAGRYPKHKRTAEQRILEWERYARELAAAAAAKEKRDGLMAKDWSKLEKILSYSVVSAADKRKFSLAFVQAYGNTWEVNPYVADMEEYLPPGSVKVNREARRTLLQMPFRCPSCRRDELPHRTLFLTDEYILHNQYDQEKLEFSQIHTIELYKVIPDAIYTIYVKGPSRSYGGDYSRTFDFLSDSDAVEFHAALMKVFAAWSKKHPDLVVKPEKGLFSR